MSDEREAFRVGGPQGMSVGTGISDRSARFGHASWPEYWRAQGVPWRTEPEIEAARQQALIARRAIASDDTQSIFPFKGITLTRGDVEWLLATHESGGGHGPVDWHNEAQRTREGLDLRGANLRGVKLNDLPLARLRGGLDASTWRSASPEQREAAAVRLDSASLRGTHLEGAILWGARLDAADLAGVYLTDASAGGAHLENVLLNDAHLERANLTLSRLAHSSLGGAQLPNAQLLFAHLEETAFEGANLADARLRGAHLEGAYLGGTRLTGTDFTGASLAGATLQGAFVDFSTNLRNAVLTDAAHGSVSVAEMRGMATLSIAPWSQVRMLGDDQEARRDKTSDGAQKTRSTRIEEYDFAIRANHQLAVALRTQGLTSEANRFAYRADLLRRKALLLRRSYGRGSLSLLLDALTGYGYRLWRIPLAYGIVLLAFAALYFVLGLPQQHAASPTPQPALDALLLSLSALHGRTFLEQLGIHSVQAWVTSAESLVGLLLEAIFVATLVQRFLSR
ncbi:MAG TPA: pentapeptide repeat-containing protein [Ktedonobacterales bacterium]|nr:pentapeptide repeat-containing protein [Ktedonobacterales bacterium]